MFNHSLGNDSVWKCVEFKVMLPLMVPPPLRKYGAVMKLGAQDEPLVPSAIKAGICLTRVQLESLQRAEGFPLPPSGSGSGKNGNLVKEDYARAAVTYYFPTATQPEFDHMFQALMGNTKVTACPEEVLKAIEALDPMAKEDWYDVKQASKQQRAAQAHVKAPPTTAPPDLVPPEAAVPREISLDAPSSARTLSRAPSDGAYERKHFTPPTLQSLIPGRGEMPYVYIKRLPGIRKTYQGFYPGSLAISSSVKLVCLEKTTVVWHKLLK